MKKMIFLVLTLLIWGAASMNAQVAIGTTNNPHSGAILDLQSTTQGLKLPNVALNNNLKVFGLPDTDSSADAKGMYVYNTNPTIGEGVYVWDGYQWIQVKANIGEIPVTSITIAPSESDSVWINPGGTVQLRITLSPANASNKNVTWSIVGGNTHATVDATGLVTGVSNGRALIRATASNGLYQEQSVFVIDLGSVAKQTVGSGSYATIRFGSLVWMVENMKNVPSVGSYKTTYNADGPVDPATNGGSPLPIGVRGYYYDWTAAQTLCPAPWRLPTVSEAEITQMIRENFWFTYHLNGFITYLLAAGEYSNGRWRPAGGMRTWTQEAFKFGLNGTQVDLWDKYPTDFLSVVCVKDWDK